MELKTVEKDEEVGLPCQVLSSGSGWARGPAPVSGLLVVLSDLEKQSGGVLLSWMDLEKAGWVREEK